eukprot:CAMPEP_0118992754 /NCGR_PEP_ID=MMETSP1173-20130426/53918_1 /TAXON_ID=1034831 /ORGANISM="Rhizochromulina marina cf, Strain CCMP1243" /LENGTH=39 /DNA_ID= /DNA_START= /DNA_END= /DNA_ORIENTATION=
MATLKVLWSGDTPMRAMSSSRANARCMSLEFEHAARASL